MELVYGPVQSLRYGATVGINFLGSTKVCSYDCVYCDLGPSRLTMNKIRKEYVFPSLDDVRTSFREYVKKSVPCDNIVISGDGEPTLYPQFDEAAKLITQLRDEHFPGRKVIVLSNGAHLDNKRVVSGLNGVDEAVIKLDAGNDRLLQKVNAPLVRINLSKLIVGIGKLNSPVVQSTFVRGEFENSQGELLDEWIEIVGMIKPRGVQLCTLTRPPQHSKVSAVDEDTLYSIAFKLKKRTGIEASVFARPKS